MCCRYYYNIDGIQNDIDDLDIGDGRIWDCEGEIRPGSESLIVAGRNGRLSLSRAVWGFPAKDKSLVINARSESALQRPMFSGPAMYRRCAVPAMKFYEWDPDRQLAEFMLPARGTMFLAGVWDLFGEIPRFVIMTAPANPSVIAVHDRMPLIIEKCDVRSWILDGSSYSRLTKRVMPELETFRKQEQLRLF